MIIAQITDTHIGFDRGNPDELNRKRLDQVVAAIAKMTPTPDLVVLSGDLTDHGDAESYEQLRTAIAPLPCPVWPIVGNHDVRQAFVAAFPDLPSDPDFIQYEVDAGALRLLMLDTLEEGRHGGAFCPARADWLRERLREQPERPTLIVMHHPPFDAGIEWMATRPNEPWVARFAEAIAGHNNIVGILCGHLHRNIAVQWQQNTVSVCASSAPQLALELAPIDPQRTDGRPMIEADAPNYALHYWNGRELVTHFTSTAERPVLARYDHNMQGLVQQLIAERESDV